MVRAAESHGNDIVCGCCCFSFILSVFLFAQIYLPCDASICYSIHNHTSCRNRNVPQTRCNRTRLLFPQGMSSYVFTLLVTIHIQFNRRLQTNDNNHFDRNHYNNHFKIKYEWWRKNSDERISWKLLICLLNKNNSNERWHFHCYYCRHCSLQLFAWKAKRNSFFFSTIISKWLLMC